MTSAPARQEKSPKPKADGKSAFDWQDPLRFDAVLEEGENGKFSPTKVVASSTGKSLKIQGEDCQEYEVRFNDIPASWWVTAAGKLCRMNIPSLSADLEMATEIAAKKFL